MKKLSNTYERAWHKAVAALIGMPKKQWLELGVALSVVTVSAGVIIYAGAGLASVNRAYDQVNETAGTIVAVPNVSQSPQPNFHGDCVLLGGKIRGQVFINAGHTYRVCVPNGWTLYYPTDLTGKPDPMNYLNEGYLTYKPNISPVVQATGGSDGVRELTIGYETSVINEPAGYKQIGIFKALMRSGKVYQYKQTTKPKDGEVLGLGELPLGATCTDYTLREASAGLGLSYCRSPDWPDLSTLMASIASSLDFE